MNNKTLLILYGEYRTFDTVFPQLKKLDEVDIIFSTWDKSTSGCAPNQKDWYKEFTLKETNIKVIQKKLPNLKLIVTNQEVHLDKSVVWKIVYHWRNALNHINGTYDKIFVHRCDMVSNWDMILTEDLDNQSLYIDCHEGWRDDGNLWINDMFFYGNGDVVKNFINSITEPLEKLTPPEIHSVLLNTIINNKIKYKKSSLIKFRLIRWYLEDFFKQLTKSNINYIDTPKKWDKLLEIEKKYINQNLDN